MAAREPSAAHVVLLEKLIGALTAKGILTEAEIAAKKSATEKASPETGARMVARAWTNPEFRARLLADGTAAAEEFGISLAGNPPLGVLEDTPALHHLVDKALPGHIPASVQSADQARAPVPLPLQAHRHKDSDWRHLLPACSQGQSPVFGRQ